MRRKRGFVLISAAIALVLLAGVAWYAYLLSETKRQHVLQQAAQKFLQENKDGHVPRAPTAAEVWAAQERMAAAGGSATSEQGSARRQVRPQPPVPTLSAGFFDIHGIPLLSSALLVTALTALGLAGSTYRLAKQGGRVRLERDDLARELESVRANDAPPYARPAPPWQESALTMVRSSSVPAIAYDLEARVLEVSEAFTRITGYMRADIPDVRSWFTKLLRTPESELEAALESFRSNVPGREIETKTVWTRSGEARTWLCQPLEVWPLEGDALLLVARATDVTAETEAARIARGEVELMQATFNAEAEAARAARAEAESLRAALREAQHVHGDSSQPASAPSADAQLASQPAGRDEEFRQLEAELAATRERLAAQQAEVAALRAQETVHASRAQALANEQQQAALLEAAYGTAATGLCLLDADLELLRANERWHAMTRDAGSMQAVLRAIAPLAREALRTRARTHSATLHLGDGVERTWRIDCQPVTGDNHAIAALALTADDITDQSAHMARLQEDSDRFQLFAEHFDDGLWIADPRLPRLLYASEQAARLRGRPLARIRADFSHWTDAIHEEDRERVLQAFHAAAVEGSYNVEYRVVRDDGAIAWLHDRGIAVRDERKRLRCLAGMTKDITVRRHAEEMTRGALATLSAIVEQAPAMIWLKDAQGRYLYANREYGKLTGFPGEQIRGKTDFQVFPRAVAERMQENEERVTANGSPQPFDESVQLADGLHHYLALRFPARGSDTAAGGLGGIAFEITERRRAEDALRAEASRYRAMASTLPEPLLVAREGKLVYANAGAAQLLGAGDAESLVGTRLQQIVTGSETGIVEAAKALAEQETGRRRFGTRLKRRDGRELEVEVSASAFETATERAVQFVVQDVGERNARVRALQETEAFFHGLCDASPAGLRLLDANGRCEFASRQWQSLVGAEASPDWFQHVHTEDQSAVRSCFAQSSRRDEPQRIEYRLRDGGGHDRWMLDTLLPRHDAQGQWKGYLAAAIDISERKRLEDALRAEHEDLEALLDRCPGPVWIAEADGSGYANRACLAWLGVDPDATSDVDLGAHVHPREREHWARVRERHTQDGTRLEAELRLRRHDGAYRQVQITGVPVVSRDGAQTRLVGFLEDVTELRETARALEAAERRRTQVIELLGTKPTDGLAQVRHTAELVRLMFPEEPRLQQVSGEVLSEAQRLEGLMQAMIEPLRQQQTPS